MSREAERAEGVDGTHRRGWDHSRPAFTLRLRRRQGPPAGGPPVAAGAGLVDGPVLVDRSARFDQCRPAELIFDQCRVKGLSTDVLTLTGGGRRLCSYMLSPHARASARDRLPQGHVHAAAGAGAPSRPRLR